MTDEYKLVYLIVAITVIGACFTIIVGAVSACTSASTTANTTSVQQEYKDVLATYNCKQGLDKNLTL